MSNPIASVSILSDVAAHRLRKLARAGRSRIKTPFARGGAENRPRAFALKMALYWYRFALHFHFSKISRPPPVLALEDAYFSLLRGKKQPKSVASKL
jgi:hypothetical protein